MSSVRNEVLEADRAYAADFGGRASEDAIRSLVI
jgi:hypothetical protein